MKHSEATAIHRIYAWAYADEAAREAASGFVAADVGRLAWQQSDHTFWVLVDDSPITWAQLGGSADANAFHGNVAEEIDALDEKAAPVAGDWVLIEDSEDGFAKKKVDADNFGGGGGSLPTLAFDKKTRTSGSYSTTSTSFVDVDATNMAITITTGARRCRITVSGSGENSAAASCALDVTIDGTRQGGTYGLIVAHPPNASGSVNISFSFVTDVLTEDEHIFKLQYRTDSGTFGLRGTSAVNPLVFSVEELLYES